MLADEVAEMQRVIFDALEGIRTVLQKDPMFPEAWRLDVARQGLEALSKRIAQPDLSSDERKERVRLVLTGIFHGWSDGSQEFTSRSRGDVDQHLWKLDSLAKSRD